MRDARKSVRALWGALCRIARRALSAQLMASAHCEGRDMTRPTLQSSPVSIHWQFVNLAKQQGDSEL